MSAQNTPGTLSVAAASVLVMGNMVGAGILGLPVMTGLAGFPLAVAALLVVWAGMLLNGITISGKVLEERKPEFDLPALFGRVLGPFGKWLAVAANLLVLYGFLIAYLCGGSTIIIKLFHLPLPEWAVVIGFFIITTGLTLFGLKVVQKGNGLLVVLMWVAFLAIIALALPSVELHRLEKVDLNFIPAALPVMVAAFHFHNIIPTLCRGLAWKQRDIKRAMFMGTVLGLCMNVLWVFTVLGTVEARGPGGDTILNAFENGLPITVTLSQVLQSPAVTIFGLVFAMLAITTSYLTYGTALLSFMRDITKNDLNLKSKSLVAVLAFGPPFLVAISDTGVFLKALDMVGGVGIALLFGLLPGYLALQKASSGPGRILAMAVICFFALILGFEICQELGLLALDPGSELWKVPFKL